MSTGDLKEEFEDQAGEIMKDEIFSPELRKKLVRKWAVRTLIALVIYIAFWNVEWIRWTLWFYIPLNLFSLLGIFAWPYFLKRKMERTRRKIDELDNIYEDVDEIGD